jgi:hypothetical protein
MKLFQLSECADMEGIFNYIFWLKQTSAMSILELFLTLQFNFQQVSFFVLICKNTHIFK